jgi:hypothetical protein
MKQGRVVEITILIGNIKGKYYLIDLRLNGIIIL